MTPKPEHMSFLAMLNKISGSLKTVYVHSARRWHYGDCFPDPDNCAVPNGEDLDEVWH